MLTLRWGMLRTVARPMWCFRSRCTHKLACWSARGCSTRSSVAVRRRRDVVAQMADVCWRNRGMRLLTTEWEHVAMRSCGAVVPTNLIHTCARSSLRLSDLDVHSKGMWGHYHIDVPLKCAWTPVRGYKPRHRQINRDYRNKKKTKAKTRKSMARRFFRLGGPGFRYKRWQTGKRHKALSKPKRRRRRLRKKVYAFGHQIRILKRLVPYRRR